MIEGSAFIVGELRRGSDANRWTRSTRNPGMARFSRLRSVEGRTGSRGSAAATVVASCTSGSGRKPALYSHYPPTRTPISSKTQPPFPGSQEMERRIKSLVRWNALAMVIRANKIQEGIGGHISTFASAATLYEVPSTTSCGARTEEGDRDIVYFQGQRRPRHVFPRVSRRAHTQQNWKTSDGN